MLEIIEKNKYLWDVNNEYYQKVFSSFKDITLNYKVYLIGGAVRQGLLGKISQDLDFSTSAPKVFLKELGMKSLGFGVFERDGFHITPFRHDGTYKNSRYPSEVTEGTHEQDALRRDFTINALYLDIVNLDITDFFGGYRDLQNKTLKVIGDPYSRFEEDPLRILRLFRFSIEDNLHIESQTLNVALSSLELLNQLTQSRLTKEWQKMTLEDQNQTIKIYPALKSYIRE
jgi:tRNA nucleotidyltransferase (CCA-adding enzyme)